MSHDQFFFVFFLVVLYITFCVIPWFIIIGYKICDPGPQSQSWGSKTSSESWINKLFFDVWFVRNHRTIFGRDTTIWKIWNLKVQKKKKKKKIAFKVVQMKFLAMHITKQKLRFYIFTVGCLQNIFMKHDLYSNDFWHKRKINNFDPNNVLLAIATNKPLLLMTGFDMLSITHPSQSSDVFSHLTPLQNLL